MRTLKTATMKFVFSHEEVIFPFDQYEYTIRRDRALDEVSLSSRILFQLLRDFVTIFLTCFAFELEFI